MAQQPDYSNMIPKRLITMSMADKYTAVCFIYDGVKYQDLCKEKNPDGTWNYSEKCLSTLSYSWPFLGFDSRKSLNNSEQGLEKYSSPGDQEADFPDLLSAIYHYRIEVFFLCFLSALLFNVAFIFFRPRSLRLLSSIKYYLFGSSRLHNEETGENSPRLGLRSEIKKTTIESISRGKSPSSYSTYLAGPTIDKEGKISIGKVSFKSESVLGYGSKGTCVFEGYYEDSQRCAVKRIVSQYINIADREVDFLRSLQNPNLVRYLATEKDAQFIYIALELAEFTLSDLVEFTKSSCSRSSKTIENMDLGKEELCHQAASGLEYLHKLDIVHRDIKPQNILISFPIKGTMERKVMISDFGLSKQLGGKIDMIHSSSAVRSYDGTQGWMAPEILRAAHQLDLTQQPVKKLLPSKSADVFSLGCVFYYVMSGGKHPFGHPSQRQTNIIKNESVFESFKLNEQSLEIAEGSAVMANKLITTMIRPVPSERPPMSCVLKYPLFWSKANQLQFLQDVSDRVDKEENGSEIVRKMERSRQKIFAFGWKDCLSEDLKAELSTHRSYNERSVRHLLRVIRNKRHHYGDLSTNLKLSLGEIPDGYMTYFSSRFPELLPHVYQAMQCCKEETIFRNYYEQKDSYLF